MVILLNNTIQTDYKLYCPNIDTNAVVNGIDVTYGNYVNTIKPLCLYQKPVSNG